MNADKFSAKICDICGKTFLPTRRVPADYADERRLLFQRKSAASAGELFYPGEEFPLIAQMNADYYFSENRRYLRDNFFIHKKSPR